MAEGQREEPQAVNAEEGLLPVTADGGVSKRILKPGEGERPPKHARCLVHYVGRLKETGEVFMDSKAESQSQEPATVVAGRDSVAREVGLNLAVATMRPGERAELHVSPQYGYGERGSFSFPTVPPNAHLVYEVELLGFEAAKDDKEPRQMMFEERLEAAERRRIDGNELFKQKSYEEALAKYRHALSYLDEDLLMQLQGHHLDKAVGLRCPILLNMAACNLQQGDFHAAVSQCSEVIREEPANAKALFRRGKARRLLGQTEAAQGDLEKACLLAPGDKAIAKELQLAKADLRREREAEAKLFGGFFEKAKEAGGALYEETQAEGTAGSPGSSDSRLQQQQPAWPRQQGVFRKQQQQAGSLVGKLLSWVRSALSALFPAFFQKFL